MLKLILLAASMLQSPAPFRELKVGDVIELTSIRDAPVYASPQSEAPAPASVVVPVPVPAADPTGFVAALNAYRAAHGRRPLAVDPALSADAASSNAAMHALGFNHHYGHAPRQKCIAVVAGWSPLALWQRSAAHNRWLLDPGLTACGFATDGTFATFSAY